MNNIFIAEVFSDNIDDYDEFILKYFNCNKSQIRENKLCELLNEPVNNLKFTCNFLPTYISVDGDRFDINLSRVFGRIESIIFEIESYKIKSIKLDIKIISTEYGNIIMELIKNGIEVKLKPMIGPNDKIIKFYANI
jgi:hypothetical protein